MDCHSSPFLTPELRRLSTFQGTPSGVFNKFLRNSPLKFVEAGFQRGLTDDEVVCPDCRTSFKNWEGESPIGVHRVISPKCPFVNPPAVEDATESLGSLQELAGRDVRRRLFQASSQNDFTSAIAVRNTIKHPIRPKCGGYEMHLASCRQNVSPFCAFVLLYDVGNISQKDETTIRMKYFLQTQKSEPLCPQNFAIVHPHFEDINVRKATYEHWPPLVAELFSADLMAAAGFYYTGYLDKVTCYACGVAFHDWRKGADVWTHHASASPKCSHVVQEKNSNFIQNAAQTELIVKVIRPEGREDGVPGSRTLDVAALKAAFARQYTKEQILHAVIKYFVMTSKFPTEELLLGILSAADENNEARRKLRRDLYIQETAVQARDQALQAKDQALQTKDQALQIKDLVIQGVIQEKNQVIQEKDRTMQEKDRVMQEKDRVMQEKDRAMQEELDIKNQEIECLRKQVKNLVAFKNSHQPSSQPHATSESQQQAGCQERDNIPSPIRCKVCLRAESSTIFMPCSHVSTCTECAFALYSRGRHCPVCRGKIEKTMSAFIS